MKGYPHDDALRRYHRLLCKYSAFTLAGIVLEGSLHETVKGEISKDQAQGQEKKRGKNE